MSPYFANGRQDFNIQESEREEFIMLGCNGEVFSLLLRTNKIMNYTVPSAAVFTKISLNYWVKNCVFLMKLTVQVNKVIFFLINVHQPNSK